jgi:hypothetical protein
MRHVSKMLGDAQMDYYMRKASDHCYLIPFGYQF